MLMIAQCFLLSGCFSCLSSWCLGEETYERLRHPKGLGEYWEKPGMTKDSWKADWIDCGGNPNGTYSTRIPPKSTQQVINDEFSKKSKEIWACMTNKGYQYTAKYWPK
jgi:hypothetical protein